MKHFLTIIVLSIALITGCGSASTPVAPDVDSFHANGLDILITGDRVLAAVVPGTNMSANELRVYFAVNMTKASFIWYFWCPVYKQFMVTFNGLPDATIYSWVTVMESNGYDVPNKGNGIPPAPIC